MDSNPVLELTSALNDWESRYYEAQPHLSLTDVYIIWLNMFRLSRRVINDYRALARAGGQPPGWTAYTGETQRLR